MTVEAALVLPLFLFFFLNLGSVLEMMRLHSNIEMALRETGNKISIYGSSFAQGDEKPEKESWWQPFGDIALTYGYVRQDMIRYLGKDYLDNSPLLFGSDSLQFVGSEILQEGGDFEIRVTYPVKSPLSVIGLRTVLLENVYYGHLWSGYEIADPSEAGNAQEKLYYVTENGRVYHETKECTHLKLSKHKVSRQEALTAVNQNGQRYQVCDKCGDNVLVMEVWIADQGTCYHTDENCPGLKRTIFVITEKEIAKYRPCQRCVP